MVTLKSFSRGINPWKFPGLNVDTDAWMMGGGKLAGSFLEAGLLTEFRVFVIPLVLGEGIPLLSGVSREHILVLTESESYPSGIVELRYRP